MTPELQLLIGACALARGLTPVPTLPIEPIDLKELLDLAKRHKVLDALSPFFKTRPQLTTPDFMASLKKELQAKAMHSTLIIEEWKNVTKNLEAEGFPVMSLKGPALSLQLYGKPNFREMRDLDFIVNTRNLHTLLPAMEKIGYDPEYFQSSYSAYQEKLFRKCVHHMEFRKSGHPVDVEIHSQTWKVTEDSFPVTVAELFQHSQTLDWEGQTYRIPGEGYHFAYMLTHGSTHAWCLLHWVLDFAVLWNQSDDKIFEEFLAVVKKYSLEGHFQVAHQIAGKFFLLTPRACVSPKDLEPTYEIKKFSSFCLSQFHEAGRKLTGLRGLKKNTFLFRLFSHKSTFWNQIYRLIIPNLNDINSVILPNSLGFLYYFLRPCLFIYRLTIRILRIFHLTKQEV